MMKYLLVFFSILAISCSTTSRMNNGVDSQHKIKSIKEASFKIEGDSIIGRSIALKEKLRSLKIYDRNNNVTEWTEFDESGKLLNKTIYDRDSNGVMVNSMVVDLYDSILLIKEASIIKKGKVIEYKAFDPEGILVAINSYKYDNRENLFEDKINLVKEGNKSYTTTYKYNSENKIKKRTMIFEPENQTFIHKYKYDKVGNVVQETFKQLGVPQSFKYLYQYNENDDEIEILKYAGKILLGNRRYEYEYDNYGNWITKKEYLKNKLNRVTYREIVYY
jgi:hypothetical protein